VTVNETPTAVAIEMDDDELDADEEYEDDFEESGEED
jgi:hypothetical protein